MLEQTNERTFLLGFQVSAFIGIVVFFSTFKEKQRCFWVLLIRWKICCCHRPRQTNFQNQVWYRKWQTRIKKRRTMPHYVLNMLSVLEKIMPETDEQYASFSIFLDSFPHQAVNCTCIFLLSFFFMLSNSSCVHEQGHKDLGVVLPSVLKTILSGIEMRTRLGKENGLPRNTKQLHQK